jgi:hypothetical protein
MQQELNHTVQTMLGSRRLEEVPREQLEGLVLEFPYASPLRLLYTKKLQLLRDPGYADQVSRTALYFNNPHWLNFQLWNREIKDLWDEAETAPEVTQGMRTAAQPSPEFPTVEIVSPVPLKEVPHDETATAEPSPGLPTVEMVSPAPLTEVPQDERARTESEPELPKEEMISPETLLPHPMKPWHEPSVRTLHTEGFSVSLENFPADPGDFQPVPSTPEPVAMPDAEPLIPLEPYYTIDYFASQGIKLTEAENQDNLGRKLKSFTDWLKTMKKVHSEKREPAIDAFAEARIKEGADRSNDLKEVWTEAMAEVYLKQGLKHKALEVYRKLSLQNPAQSANFAAKIAELND